MIMHIIHSNTDDTCMRLYMRYTNDVYMITYVLGIGLFRHNDAAVVVKLMS